MSLIDWAQHRSRTTLAAFFFLLVAGSYAFSVIPKEADPDISIPIVYVVLSHDGISPVDAEKLLVRPVEKELRSLEGLKELSSQAYEHGGSVTVEFEAGYNIEQALIDVREKVDKAKAELPADSDEPSIHEVNLSRFPVLNISLYGNASYRLLRQVGHNLKDEIEALTNVLSVDLIGDRDEVIEIIMSPQKLETYNLQATALLQALQRANLLIAAGALKQTKGRFSIEVAGKIENADDLLNLPLVANNEGVITVKDIASVRRTFKQSDNSSRINGYNAITLLVKKRTGRNIIATIDQVQHVIKHAKKLLPDNIKIIVGQDKSQNIRDTLKDLVNNITSAILLVMIVILASLGFRSGLLVGLTIPGSFLTAILILYISGFTVNIVVLFALILSVGMLVDGAIVVSEYAERQHKNGKPLKDAFSLAAKQMAWPIIASTLTTLAAFLPLVFWPGIVGEFMKYLPITVMATLSASLLMALIFLPLLGTHLRTIAEIAFVITCVAITFIITLSIAKFIIGSWAILIALCAAIASLTLAMRHKDRVFAKISTSHKQPPPSQQQETTNPQLPSLPVSGFGGLYVKVLQHVLQHPAKVLLSAFGLLIAVYVTYGVFGKGVEFFPDIEPELFSIDVSARGNLSLPEKSALVEKIESHVLALQNERYEFKLISTQVGGGGRNSPDDSIGVIDLQLADWRKRRKASRIIEDLRDRIGSIAGIRLNFVEEESGPPSASPVHVRISGTKWRDIEVAANRLREYMDSDARFVNIQDSLPISGIVWELDIERSQALKFGVDVETLGSFVKLVTQGLKITDIQPDDSIDKVDIVARFPQDYRSLEQLADIRINTPAGPVPASVFMQRLAKLETPIIRRIDSERIHFVKSDVSEGVLVDTVVQDFNAWLETQPPFDGVNISFQGEEKDKQEAEAFLSKAFSVALFIMAVILLTQFNNFYNVVLILLAVVMSTVGVFIGLLVTGQPFGIVMCGIGVIALAGIVVNNNIVLIDTYDKYAQSGLPTQCAVVRTAAERLRPVLLTTITTILGLLPMTLKINIDFLTPVIEIGGPSTQWWSQLATAIIFGLAFATLLTLIVTPSALVLRAKLGLLPKYNSNSITHNATHNSTHNNKSQNSHAEY